MLLLTLYNLVFAAGLALLLPLHLLRLCFVSKHRRSTLPRLGWQQLPSPAPGDKVIWIDLDLDGIQEMEKCSGFSPLRVGDGPKMHLEDNIPNDPAEFKRRSKVQWEWGVEQIRRVDLRRKGG